MNLRRWLRRNIEYFRPTPVQPGHRYRDTITGELVTVESVGRMVKLRRDDAEMQEHVSTPVDRCRMAIEKGLLVHDEDRCQKC